MLRPLQIPLLVFIALGASSVGAAVQTIALSGDLAPGAPDSAVFKWFDYRSVAINNDGQVVFPASFKEPGTNIASGSGFWSYTDGQLRPIAITGGPAPGVPGGSYRYIESLAISNTGQFAFNAGINGTPEEAFGLWKGNIGEDPKLTYATGQPAPGSNASFRAFHPPQFNQAGKLLVHANLKDDPMSRSGYWIENGNSLQKILLEGDPAPGVPGVQFGSTYHSEVFGPTGRFGFVNNLVGDDITTDNNASSWVWTDSTGLRMVAREGMSIPGAAEPLVYELLSAPLLTASGDLLIAGSYINTTNFESGRAIWRERADGTMEWIVGKGDVASGTGGRRFEFVVQAAANAQGDVAYFGGLQESGFESGVWVTSSLGDQRLVFSGSTRLPGLPSDLPFYGDGLVASVLNARGQVAISLQIDQEPLLGGVYGVWIADADGQIYPIAIPGNLLRVGVNDFREVEDAYFLEETLISTSQGRLSPFNDRGELLFVATFTDGSSGLFLATVPEPALGWFTFVCVGLFVRRLRVNRR